MKNLSLFKGVDFDKLYTSRPPVHDISSPYKKKRKESGDDDEFFNVEYKQNEEAPKGTPNKSSFATQGSGIIVFENQEETKEENTIHTTQLLKPQPVVTTILSGLVEMRGWFFYSTRRLVLQSNGALLYQDPDTNSVKVYPNVTRL